MHTILLSGRKIFYGWPYYSWSAGYDTATRGQIVNDIYGGNDPERIRSLVTDNHISYIVIDNGNRQSENYHLNEPLLRRIYPLAIEIGEFTSLKCKD